MNDPCGKCSISHWPAAWAVLMRALRLALFALCAGSWLGVSTTAHAQGPGWTAASTVVSVVNTANGGFNIRLSPELVNCVSQSGYGPQYASVYPNHAGLNRFKADMLTALVTGKKVMLYLGDSNCQATESILMAD